MSGGARLRLLLTMLAWPDGAYPDSREIDMPCRVGRQNGECDWLLADPRQVLSRLHCEFLPAGEGWRVTDRSSNGTYLNDEPQPIGKGQSRPLRDGDRVRLGAYVIEARAVLSGQMVPDVDYPPYAAGGGYGAAPGQAGAAPAGGGYGGAFGADWAEPWGGEPQPPPGARGPFGGAPDFEGPPQIDPVLPIHHVWQGPPPVNRLPDDWLSEGPPAVAGGLPADWDQEAATPAAPVAPAAPGAAIVPPRQRNERAPDPLAERREAPVMERGAGSFAHTATPARGVGPDEAGLLEAFLRGAQLSGFVPQDAAASMEQIGAAMRALVSGLSQIRDARSTVKREFRIAETMISARDHDNPLRMILNEDEALRALLSGRFAAAPAVADVLKRVRLHELALVAAMRDSVEGLLEALSPARVSVAAGEAAAPPGAAQGMGGLLAAPRKARAWDSYVALHASTTDALRDDFDSVFGKAFARAYERVLQQAADSGGDAAPGGSPRPVRPPWSRGARGGRGP